MLTLIFLTSINNWFKKPLIINIKNIFSSFCMKSYAYSACQSRHIYHFVFLAIFFCLVSFAYVFIMFSNLIYIAILSMLGAHGLVASFSWHWSSHRNDNQHPTYIYNFFMHHPFHIFRFFFHRLSKERHVKKHYIQRLMI